MSVIQICTIVPAKASNFGAAINSSYTTKLGQKHRSSNLEVHSQHAMRPISVPGGGLLREVLPASCRVENREAVRVSIGCLLELSELRRVIKTALLGLHISEDLDHSRADLQVLQIHVVEEVLRTTDGTQRCDQRHSVQTAERHEADGKDSRSESGYMEQGVGHIQTLQPSLRRN